MQIKFDVNEAIILKKVMEGISKGQIEKDIIKEINEEISCKLRSRLNEQVEHISDEFYKKSEQYISEDAQKLVKEKINSIIKKKNFKKFMRSEEFNEMFCSLLAEYIDEWLDEWSIGLNIIPPSKKKAYVRVGKNVKSANER